MAVGFGSYEIARSGLYVNERGLNTTGQNISNVNTQGYVRQQAVISTSLYQNVYSKDGLMQFGLGADIQQTRQIRNIFLDNIYRKESTSLGYWEAKNKTFEDVQAVLGDTEGNGLQDVMNEFWDSWQELAKDPSSLTARAMVRQRGDALVTTFNHMGAQLDKLQDDLNSEIKVRITEINNITQQIASMNMEIAQNEIGGDMANDYRDKRNTLLDQLCKLTDAEINEMQDGQVDVTLGGYFLVHKADSTNLEAMEGLSSGIYCTPVLEGTKIEVPVRGGTLKGLLESRGEVLASKGSMNNGTPNTKADIVIAVDTSNTSAAYLENIRNNINQYAEELIKSGIDYNLRLVTFDGSGVHPQGSASGNFGTDVNAFLTAVKSLSSNASTGNDFGPVASWLGGISDFRESAGRYAVVFTGESVSGDEINADASVASYISALTGNNIQASVVTGSAYRTTGASGETTGWDSIASATGGSLYDIAATGSTYDALMTQINSDITTSVDHRFSVVNESSNIIPDLKKQLNAMLNIMARKINYLSCSGKTLGADPQDGKDFFTVIENNRPIEMGNLKLNDNLSGQSGLNNIVASESGEIGDNTIALQIANLRKTDVMRDSSGIISVDAYFQSIVLNIGNGGGEASSIVSNQQNLVNSANSSRQSIMGVSMDEEMTNMMKYKYAYDGNAKTLNAIDQMIQTLIEKMGLVGR